jgi:hypothetical protein
MSTELPEFASHLDLARYLVRENRLHELWFDDLTQDECDVVMRDLRTKLSRMRRRSMRAHIIGAVQAVCFLGLGVTMMAIGPVSAVGAFGRWLQPITAYAIVGSWAVLVVLAALGGFTADYLLRRRLRIARMWDHESARLRETIRRGEVRDWPLPAPSSVSEGSAATDRAAARRSSVPVLSTSAHDQDFLD